MTKPPTWRTQKPTQPSSQVFKVTSKMRRWSVELKSYRKELFQSTDRNCLKRVQVPGHSTGLGEFCFFTIEFLLAKPPRFRFAAVLSRHFQRASLAPCQMAPTDLKTPPSWLKTTQNRERGIQHLERGVVVIWCRCELRILRNEELVDPLINLNNKGKRTAKSSH